MNTAKKYDLTTDERAILYNHVAEIQLAAPGFGPISILVERHEAGGFQCTLSTEDGLNFETIGRGETVFEASRAAKQELIARLQLLMSTAKNSMERSLQIFSILHGSTLH